MAPAADPGLTSQDDRLTVAAVADQAPGLRPSRPSGVLGAERAGFSFAIAEAGTGRAVGGIGLWLAQLSQGRAEAGYSVAPSARGRGIAAAALTALTTFAWSIPALHRIELHIEPWNTGSIKAAERAGYEREGLLRSHQEIGGRRRDMLLYAIIREDSALCPPQG
jgi:ribosomal-protein-alanine N-acetyltransferase